MYKIIKNKKIGDLEKKVEVLVRTLGCLPVGNVNKIEIDGEPMFVQAVYKKVKAVCKNKDTNNQVIKTPEGLGEDVWRGECQQKIPSHSGFGESKRDES